MPATLISNRGDEELRIEFLAPAEYAHDPGFESSVKLCGRHWDGDHTYPFATSIEGLWLRSADLAALRDHIANWTSQSLDKLVVKDLTREFELGRLPGQTVRIRFAPRSDTVSDRNPVVSIAFSAGTLLGEFHFVTDQSCLTLLVQDLSEQLQKRS